LYLNLFPNLIIHGYN